MKLTLRTFLRADAGAITIDWVAVTAGLLLLGIMVVYAIFNGGVSGLVSDISSTLASINTDVDTGDAPGLNGSNTGEVVVASDTFDLVGGGSVPIGSEVAGVSGNEIGIITTTGSMILRTTDGSNINAPNLDGATVGANNTFNLNGTSISASSIAPSGLTCVRGCYNLNPA